MSEDLNNATEQNAEEQQEQNSKEFRQHKQIIIVQLMNVILFINSVTSFKRH